MNKPFTSTSASWHAVLTKDASATLCLLGLIAIGAILRFYSLGEESLWIDEIASWNQSRKNDISSVIEGMRRNVHPPGWTFLLHFVQKSFGDSEFALRLPSAIAGVLAIPSIYLLGRKVFDKNTAILAATVVTVMWAPIHYSQESRAYSLLMLLAILTAYALISFVERTERGETPIGIGIVYVVLAACLAYLHYAGLLLVLIQAGWAMLRSIWSKRQLLMVTATYLLIALAYLPWMLEMLNDFGRDSFWIKNIATPKKTLDFFFFKDKFQITWLLVTLVAIAVITSLFEHRRTPLKIFTSNHGLVFGWLLLPYLAFYAKSVLGTPILLPRYILISAPAAYLIVAYGLAKISRATLATPLACSVILIGSIWVVTTKINYYSEPQKAQFKEVIQTLSTATEVSLDDAFVMSYRSSNVFNYYFSHMGLDRTVDHRIKIDKSKRNRPVPPEEISFLKNLLHNEQKDHVWLIVGNPRTPREVLIMMNEHYDVARFEDFKNTQAILYVLKASHGDESD